MKASIVIADVDVNLTVDIHDEARGTFRPPPAMNVRTLPVGAFVRLSDGREGTLLVTAIEPDGTVEFHCPNGMRK